ncbi:MAG: GntR family transcriptional regulator [Candidatus Acidiferrales bacterium]
MAILGASATKVTRTSQVLIGLSPRANKSPLARRFLDGLHLNRRSALPIQAQIEAQIRYAIATGELKAGDPLPSINDLAQRLSVNRNTIHQVYQHLSAAGLLESAHGRGVFISAASDSVAEAPALSELIERTLREAVALGVSPRTFSRFLQSQAHAFEAHFPLVAFVECNPYQSNEFAQQIAERWQMKVMPVLLSAVRQSLALPVTCKVVLTTYFHYPEVRKSIQRRDLLIRPVVVDVITGLRKALRQAPDQGKVGVISRFEGVSEVEEVIAAEARTRSLHLRTFSYREGDERGLKRFLAGLDVLICPDAARDALLRIEARKVPPRILEWKASLDVAQLDSLQMSIPLVRTW